MIWCTHFEYMEWKRHYDGNNIVSRNWVAFFFWQTRKFWAKYFAFFGRMGWTTDWPRISCIIPCERRINRKSGKFIMKQKKEIQTSGISHQWIIEYFLEKMVPMHALEKRRKKNARATKRPIDRHWLLLIQMIYTRHSLIINYEHTHTFTHTHKKYIK